MSAFRSVWNCVVLLVSCYAVIIFEKSIYRDSFRYLKCRIRTKDSVIVHVFRFFTPISDQEIEYCDMEGNLLKEISYLTRLIEQHKQSGNLNSFGKQEDRKWHSQPSAVYGTDKQSRSSNYSYVKPSVPSGRVHLNPNFKPKVPGIHVNPRIGAKSSVHLNPKMMKNFSTQNSAPRIPDVPIAQKNPAQSIVRTKIEPSVHVNPRLMKELSSCAKERSASLKKTVTTLGVESKPEVLVVHTKTKLVKNNSSPSTGTRRLSNSNLVSLSRRKLVRIRRSSKTGPLASPTTPTRVRRLSSLNLRKTKVATKYKLVMECAKGSGAVGSVLRSVRNRQTGLNRYKIDRTHIEKVKKRLSIGKNSASTVNKKASGSTTGLVRIGGILYKSSRNQLVRSSNDQQTTKRKRCIINVKGDRFVMASGGKKLRRVGTSAGASGRMKSNNLVSRVDIGGMTFVEKTPNVLVRAHTGHSISAKAKQRSIQILRNKMRKNNQPCLIFQKFGYCTGQVKGTCPKLHDKKQVALCRNFLQGNCLLDKCPMSHAVCPEKMPTCKYFLEGCCIRDNCPYLHVKVSPNTPICSQFLRGYCAEANKCKQRHVYLCPDYERSGNCVKGKYCPYPHKQNSSDYKKKKSTKIIIERGLLATGMRLTTKSDKGSSSAISSNNEERKRYYDEAGGSKEDVERKRDTVLNNIRIMKGVKIAERDGDDTELKQIIVDHENKICQNCNDNNEESDQDESCPKRPPLGPLPAYIPID